MCEGSNDQYLKVHNKISFIVIHVNSLHDLSLFKNVKISIKALEFQQLCRNCLLYQKKGIKAV